MLGLLLPVANLGAGLDEWIRNLESKSKWNGIQVLEKEAGNDEMVKKSLYRALLVL